MGGDTPSSAIQFIKGDVNICRPGVEEGGGVIKEGEKINSGGLCGTQTENSVERPLLMIFFTLTRIHISTIYF